MPQTFKTCGIEFPINIDHFEAIDVFPEKFKIDLLELFTDEQKCIETMNAIALADLETLKLMYYFMEKDGCAFTWVEFIKGVKSPDIRHFRDSFWRAVEDFFGPPKDRILRLIWKEFQKQLKNPDPRSIKLDLSDLDFNQEESTSTDSP